MVRIKMKVLLLSAAVILISAVCFVVISGTETAWAVPIKKTIENHITGKLATNALNKTASDNAENKTADSQSGAAAKLQTPAGTSGAAKAPEVTQQNQSRQAEPLSQILDEKGISDFGSGVKIVVSKSSHTLSLVYNGEVIKSYHVELGEGGTGDKQVEGDHKTPEGTFYVTDKQVMDPPDYYLGSRWLGVSYPNIEDAQRGLQQGLIDQQTYDEIVNAVNNGENPPQDTALGGNIGIHGGSVPSFGSDWTWGCVGLKNSDIQEFYGYMHGGTPIIIQK